jgi:hypothetical protein
MLAAPRSGFAKAVSDRDGRTGTTRRSVRSQRANPRVLV